MFIGVALLGIGLVGLAEWLLKKRRALADPSRLDELILWGGGLSVACLIRLVYLNYEAPDFGFCLLPWYNQIEAHGLGSITYQFCNYPPLYLHLVALGTHLPLPPLYLYKFIAFGADFACAWLTYRSLLPSVTSRKVAIVAALGVLVAPTVVYNSALMSQADMTYTVFLVLAAHLMGRGSYGHALVAVGLAFCFKLQAVFFALPVAALWVRGKVTLPQLLVIPGAYVLSTIPSGLLGRGWLDVLTIYVHQTTHFPSLTLCAPSVYAFLAGFPYLPVAYVGIALTGGFLFFFAYLVMVKRMAFTPRLIISLGLLSTLGIPYLLPSMHERYFFAADIFAILYAFHYPRRFFVPIVMIFCSFMSYNCYLVSQKYIGLAPMALALGTLLIYLIRQFVREIWRGSPLPLADNGHPPK